MTPGNPVVGGTVLRRPAIASPNYVPGVSGWSINADGSAEFNDVTIRGSLVGTTDFSYSGTPAAGNLVQTSGIITPGTDGFGNNTLAGQSTYGAGFACSVIGGAVIFYTGSLAGGWTAQGELLTDTGGDLLSSFTGDLVLSGGLTASGDTGTALPAGTPTGGPNSGTFAGHTHDFDGHTHAL